MIFKIMKNTIKVFWDKAYVTLNVLEHSTRRLSDVSKIVQLKLCTMPVRDFLKENNAYHTSVLTV